MGQARQRFNVPIDCPNCGQQGMVVWEEAAGPELQHGAQRRLVAVNGDFHIEAGRTRSGGPLVICSRCDQIQKD